MYRIGNLKLTAQQMYHRHTQVHHSISHKRFPTPASQIRLRRVRHPLLLARYLTLQAAFKQQQNLLKLAAEDRLPSAQQARLPADRDIIQPHDVKEPVPIDFAVQRGVKGIVVTGPNTGGKTAALKCLGLVALMAKCGIPLPARPTVLLPWFEQV